MHALRRHAGRPEPPAQVRLVGGRPHRALRPRLPDGHRRAPGRQDPTEATRGALSHGDRRLQLVDDRLPRGPRGGPDPRRRHRELPRRQPRAAPPGLPRRRWPRFGPRSLTWFAAGGPRTGSPGSACASRRSPASSPSSSCSSSSTGSSTRSTGPAGSPSTTAGAAKLLARRRDRGARVGLVALGFTSVYREGFETVLFLQNLRVTARLRGRAGGRGDRPRPDRRRRRFVFVLQQQLPYKKMLIVTGMIDRPRPRRDGRRHRARPSRTSAGCPSTSSAPASIPTGWAPGSRSTRLGDDRRPDPRRELRDRLATTSPST